LCVNSLNMMYPFSSRVDLRPPRRLMLPQPPAQLPIRL
jgi:hypothetical protein